MFVDLVKEVSGFLSELKSKKDFFKYKIEIEGERLIVWIKREEKKNVMEYKISYDASPEMMNLIDIKNDLLDILFEI